MVDTIYGLVSRTLWEVKPQRRPSSNLRLDIWFVIFKGSKNFNRIRLYHSISGSEITRLQHLNALITPLQSFCSFIEYFSLSLHKKTKFTANELHLRSFSLEQKALDKQGVSRLLTRRLHPGHRRDQVTAGACECQGTLAARAARARQSQPTCLRARPCAAPPPRCVRSLFSRGSAVSNLILIYFVPRRDG